MPSHALATIAVCEAAALSRGRDKHWQTLAQAMVNYIVATQDGDGGWSNKPVLAESIHAKIRRQREKPEPSTMLATGWTLMALRRCAGRTCDVPDKTFQRAVEFLGGMVAHGGPAGKDAGAVDYRDMRPRGRGVGDAVGGLRASGSVQAAPDAQPPDGMAGLGPSGPSGPSLHGHWVRNFLQGIVLRQTNPPAWCDWSQSLRDHLIVTQATKGQAAGSWFETAAAGKIAPAAGCSRPPWARIF